jgi:hypothetical protein
VRQGCIALLNCEEGIVNVVQGGTQKDEVGGVRWREKGDVSVSVLNCLVRGGSGLFIKGVEFRPGGSGGGH